MKFATMHTPFALDYSKGKKTAKQVIDWDMQIVRWGDEYGIAEAFFAEHYTLGFEPSPAPDLMIAAASQITKNITLGAAAHLLPYHNPVALAFRMMWLDHMTGGRYIAGVAPGAYESDAQLFGTGKNNVEMMHEGLDIIQAILTKHGPFAIKGKYWSVDMPAYDDKLEGPHLKPLQKPLPLIMTGMQSNSPTLTEAGRRGFLPMSQHVCSDILVKHWETYAVAAQEADHEPRRANWRVMRDVFVADTDEEAREIVLKGGMGRTWSEFLLPLFKELGANKLLAGEANKDRELTIDWLIDNLLFVGSPQTVADKIRKFYGDIGGFGTLLIMTHDHADNPEPYRRHIELLGTKVGPLLSDLKP